MGKGQSPNKTIKYGCDFAGLGTVGIAMQKLTKKTPGISAKAQLTEYDGGGNDGG